MSSPPPTSPPPMVWPAPPAGSVPFPLPWGATGCCPPGGMDALMQCYCDVQAATAFICSVMVSCVQNNPAVTAAIIAAIEASGSSLPLTGVTNGSNAQPGQVGEYITGTATINYAAAPAVTNILSAPLVVPPGDWDLWASMGFSTVVGGIIYFLDPAPAGMSNGMTGYNGAFATAGAPIETGLVLDSQYARGSFSVPSLLTFQGQINQSGVSGVPAGIATLVVEGRRRR